MPGCRAGSPARRRPICDALGREVDPRDLPPARCRLSLPSWPTRGDRVLKSIRIGHTEQERISFPNWLASMTPRKLATIYSLRLSTNQLRKLSPSNGASHEPLATSLSAVERVIVEPAREPTIDQLHAVVESGVTYEFCDAVAKVLADATTGCSGTRSAAAAAP
jgi:hypothetical protein